MEEMEVLEVLVAITSILKEEMVEMVEMVGKVEPVHKAQMVLLPNLLLLALEEEDITRPILVQVSLLLPFKFQQPTFFALTVKFN